MAEPVIVHIHPWNELDARNLFYLAYVNNVQVAGPTATPYRDTARYLLQHGYDPIRLLLMRRHGVEVNQLEYRIVEAAGLEFENQANPAFLWPLQQDGPGAVP